MYAQLKAEFGIYIDQFLSTKLLKMCRRHETEMICLSKSLEIFCKQMISIYVYISYITWTVNLGLQWPKFTVYDRTLSYRCMRHDQMTDDYNYWVTYCPDVHKSYQQPSNSLTSLHLIFWRVFPWNCFTNTWQFSLIFHPLQVIFIHYKSWIATAIRGL